MYEPPENPLSIDDKDTMAICVPSLAYYYGLSEYGSRGTRCRRRGHAVAAFIGDGSEVMLRAAAGIRSLQVK